jgi:hypothetical protein
MRRNPRALVEDLASLRGQIDQVMSGIYSLFRSGEAPPDSPPPPLSFRAVVEPLKPLVQSQVRPGETTPSFKPKGTPLRVDTFRNKNAWEACETCLLLRGKPAKTAEIAVVLETHGFETTSKNIRGFLYQVMRKKPAIFTRPDIGTWGLKIWNRE